MPRRPRVHIPGAFYHVTLRGNHRQPIFFSPADRDLLNAIVARALSRCGARLHAYCWMTNHIHMLLQPGAIQLGPLVLRVAGQFARSVQAGMRTTGHLFQNRYHATLVNADNQLLELLRYIHLNPVRAGLVADPDAYPWSSHHAYAGRRTEPWLTRNALLAMFDPRPDRARRLYCAFMDIDPPGPDTHEQIAFTPTATDPVAQPATAAAGLRPSRVSLSEVINEAAALFSVTRDALLSETRCRAVTRARCWIARTALERGIASVSATAQALGRDESTLRKAIGRRSRQ